jgi:Pre ATP-grasp domain/PGM1 C-terminal domain
MAARIEDVPPDVLPFYDAMSDRLLWTMSDGDFVVVNGPVKERFLSYLCGVLSVDPESIYVRSLRYDGMPSWYPRDNPALMKELHNAVGGGGAACWSVECYIRDRAIVQWERALGLDDASSDVFADGMAELMNTKSVFRAIARSSGVPIAEGRVAVRGEELCDVVVDLLAVTGAVIVKQDQNSGGDGNAVLTLDRDIAGLGARDRVVVKSRDRTRVAEALDSVGLGPPRVVPKGCGPAKLVVETYHPRASAYYVEIDVPSTGPVRVRNHGLMRMLPLWVGFEIPAHDLTAEETDRMCALAVRLGTAAQSVGYHGLMNCDAIRTEEGRLLFSEFNGRAGGATHLDTLCRRLLGEHFLDEFVLLSRCSVPSPAFTELLAIMDREALHFDPDRKAGVLVVQDNTAQTGTIEYLVIGQDLAQAHGFEERFAAAIATDGRDTGGRDGAACA